MNKKIKTVFVKSGKARNLENEFCSQKLAYETAKRSGSKIIVPEPIARIGTELTMENLSGIKSLKNVSVAPQVVHYNNCINFLEKIKVNEKVGIQKTNSHYQAISLPYFLLKNIISYPEHLPLFLLSAFKIMKYTPKWLRLKSDSFCQGDINIGNVYEFKGKTVLLDWGEATISHKYFDRAIALNSTWYKKDFRKKLLAGNKDKILQSFVAFNLMQRLTNRLKNQKQAGHYLNSLKEISKNI